MGVRIGLSQFFGLSFIFFGGPWPTSVSLFVDLVRLERLRWARRRIVGATGLDGGLQRKIDSPSSLGNDKFKPM